MTGARITILLCALAMAAASCGESKVGPGPKPPPPAPEAPAAPTGVRITSQDTTTRTAVLQWDPSPGAERYVVEYWNTFGTGFPITSVPTTGAETSVTLRDLPGDWLSIRVKAGNSGGFGAGSMPPVMLQMPIQQDIVEALFFGTGTYGTGLFAQPSPVDYVAIAPQGMHLSPGLMLGWGGGVIRVRVEEALTPAQSAYLTRALAHVTELTGGHLRPEIVERTASLPDTFAAGEIRVMVRSNLSTVCSNTGPILGCTRQLLLTGGELVAALIYVLPTANPDTVSHEVGHAIGLHHVSRVQLPVRPVMSTSAGPAENGFSIFEVDALRAVYGAGFRFGATADDFRARGLIR